MSSGGRRPRPRSRRSRTPSSCPARSTTTPFSTRGTPATPSASPSRPPTPPPSPDASASARSGCDGPPVSSPSMNRIRTLLVANRGEIACRILRTAEAMGISTVAVFSDADADSPHVAQADVAVRLPGVAAVDTYLRADLIMEAALRTGADAIHPGYGFLSENASFAQQATDAKLIFVGPSPEVITAMGSKIRAKELMAAASVPILPGATVCKDSELATLAERVGFPLLVKASAGGGGRGMRVGRGAAVVVGGGGPARPGGGGGRGMRIVREPSSLVEAVAAARREAGSAFGDETVFLERYVVDPRHVEVQILGDRFGTVVHLFERDCSVQRRFQKVVEETPS